MRKRVLVVHGRGGPSPSVREACEQGAFETTSIEGHLALMQQAMELKPALILFDAEMWRGPVEESLCLLHDLKVLRCTRKIILASKADLDDKVDAFEVGADDFLLKPISTRELLSRIDAVLRSYVHQANEEEEVQVVGDLKLFRAGMEVAVGGKITKLSPTEFHLLAYLMDQVGHVLGRDELVENIWFPRSEIRDRRVVDVYICRLREKIEEEPAHPRRLLTRRGGGYVLNDAANCGSEATAP
jgi:two-component system response regulator VicR